MYSDRVEDSLESNEINNLDRPFLVHNCFILNLSDPCPAEDKKRRRNIACSLYDYASAQEPVPRGQEI